MVGHDAQGGMVLNDTFRKIFSGVVLACILGGAGWTWKIDRAQLEMAMRLNAVASREVPPSWFKDLVQKIGIAVEQNSKLLRDVDRRLIRIENSIPK